MKKISDVPQPYTDEEIASFLENSGVLSARRQVRHVSEEDGPDGYIPLKSVILTFKSNVKLPDSVFRWVSRSIRCVNTLGLPFSAFNCRRFGHIARNCRGSTSCKICGAPHTVVE
uniref:CCHC-type domain-containing protein n=1 Tax=Ornithodoros turicata TaxID=34597 RepID=A0A2R5LGC4_9ACAR